MRLSYSESIAPKGPAITADSRLLVPRRVDTNRAQDKRLDTAGHQCWPSGVMRRGSRPRLCRSGRMRSPDSGLSSHWGTFARRTLHPQFLGLCSYRLRGWLRLRLWLWLWLWCEGLSFAFAFFHLVGQGMPSRRHFRQIATVLGAECVSGKL